MDSVFIVCYEVEEGLCDELLKFFDFYLKFFRWKIIVGGKKKEKKKKSEYYILLDYLVCVLVVYVFFVFVG